MGSLKYHNKYVSIQRGFDKEKHRGIDFQWQNGNVDATAKIHAAYDGKVESVYNAKTDGPNPKENGGWGGRVEVKVNDRVKYAISHLKKDGIKVRKGQTVRAGDLLAIMGNTGDSRGRHLHFELYIDGERVDPAPYFKNNLPGTTVRRVQKRTKRTPTGFINGRAKPTTKSPVKQKLNAGNKGLFSLGNFDGYAHGQKVTQNGVTSDVWLRGAINGNWFWIGNFADRSVSGMVEVK